jgi:hypothetical protein
MTEEVDWNETLSDEDDYDTPAVLRPSAPNFSPNWHRNPLASSDGHGVTDEDDDGLAISIGSRRGRKGSMKL